jgi:2-succinyl-5-enolpyruvyl-6-hydroxy-3-cyclohexene-1-carboxylate synthase
VNPSTAFARVLVDELLRGGVTDAVLAPGSRSAPVALALAAAERDGHLRLHVRIDERTAAFLALGLAKASGRPVPVLTTSGTAAAHLHAAVLEADASGVPLLALTADRPPELRATGANQTIEQPGLYGGAVRWSADVGVPEAGREEAQNRYWRSLVAKALLTAAGSVSGHPGPVHLNLALREPLLPDEDVTDLSGPFAGRPDGAPWTASSPTTNASSRQGHFRQRTLVVAGDGPAFGGRVAVDNAGASGWPVIAEPSSGAWGPAVWGDGAPVRNGGGLRGGALLLGVPEWLDGHRPDRVVVVGRPTLSRPVAALLADPRVEV